MDEDDKLDLIAAILASGSGERSQDAVANFRAIREQLKAEGINHPQMRRPKPLKTAIAPTDVDPPKS